jgi:hypothetical protein
LGKETPTELFRPFNVLPKICKRFTKSSCNRLEFNQLYSLRDQILFSIPMRIWHRNMF